MKYGRRVLSALLWAQVPLVAGVALSAIGAIALTAALRRGTSYRELSAIAFIGATVYAYALLAILLYGAPVYALLASVGRANWLTATLMGAAPGVGALLIGIFPSGRLADANVTVGPMIMACGIFVALATHALVREAATLSSSSRPALPEVIRRSARPLARVFVVAAILGQAWTFVLARNARSGDFSALIFLGGAAWYVIPPLLAALACALYSYVSAAKPRGVAPVCEVVVYVAIGIVLLIPAAFVVVAVAASAR